MFKNALEREQFVITFTNEWFSVELLYDVSSFVMKYHLNLAVSNHLNKKTFVFVIQAIFRSTPMHLGQWTHASMAVIKKRTPPSTPSIMLWTFPSVSKQVFIWLTENKSYYFPQLEAFAYGRGVLVFSRVFLAHI